VRTINGNLPRGTKCDTWQVADCVPILATLGVSHYSVRQLNLPSEPWLLQLQAVLAERQSKNERSGSLFRYNALNVFH
jgi:hypothetical protein